MVNDGGGTFTLDPIRAPNALLRNPPEYWRHVGKDLVDLDNDGDLDNSTTTKTTARGGTGRTTNAGRTSRFKRGRIPGRDGSARSRAKSGGPTA